MTLCPLCLRSRLLDEELSCRHLFLASGSVSGSRGLSEVVAINPHPSVLWWLQRPNQGPSLLHLSCVRSLLQVKQE